MNSVPDLPMSACWLVTPCPAPRLPVPWLDVAAAKLRTTATNPANANKRMTASNRLSDSPPDAEAFEASGDSGRYFVEGAPPFTLRRAEGRFWRVFCVPDVLAGRVGPVFLSDVEASSAEL